MRVDVGIIGGTGIGDRLLAQGGTPVHVPTPEGLLKAQLVQLGDVNALLIGRHSAGHKVPPHLVNYKAMALGLKALGVKHCLATAAVGGLRREWPGGTLVACSDFLDETGRQQTLFSRTVVHTDFSEPFGVAGRRALLEAGKELDVPIQPEGVYLCGNGPRYETPKEITLYAQFGADLVGMTAATEAILMREAGIDYACLAIVTNLAAGISPTPLSHEEVVEMMQATGSTVIRVLERAAAKLAA
jgi:5'-methylthioadenosine phosphorylase